MAWEIVDQPAGGRFEVVDTPPPQKTYDAVKLAEDVTKRGWGTGWPNVAYNAGGAVTDLLSKFDSLRGHPAAAAGYVTNVITSALPSLLTAAKFSDLTPEQQSFNALAQQKQSVLDAGRKAGFKVPPAQVNPSMTNRVVESTGGKAATAQEASAVNQDVAYAIAQREAGLKPNESINLDTLKAARDRLSQPYRDIAALPSEGVLSQPPFKSPAETLKSLQETRGEAKKLWEYYSRSKLPSALDEAKAASAKADQLEAALEAQATAAGRPELAQALREARQALAKNFTVERAMRGSSFDPSALARLESRGNTPLSGDLETIMRMYRDFPKAMNPPQIGGSVGVNQLLPLLGGGAGAAAGVPFGPGGAAMGSAAGVVLGQTVPPIARALALSGPYQSMMANFPQVAPQVPMLSPFLVNPSITGALAQ